MKSVVDYTLISIVLIAEVTVFFYGVNLPFGAIVGLFVFLLLFVINISKSRSLNISIIAVYLAIVTLIVVQGLFFGFSITQVILNPLLLIGVPYLLYRIVGDSIFEKLVNVILVAAIFTTFIWLLQLLVPVFDLYLQGLRLSSENYLLVSGTEENVRVSIAGLYTITHWNASIAGVSILRNSGFYHEPGAFSYFLILAIGINAIIQKGLINRKNIILTIILLTTFSTAGYLSLFVLLVHLVLYSKMNEAVKLLVVPLMLLIIIAAFVQLEFLQDKIEDEFVAQTGEEVVVETRGGRAGRIEASLNLLATSPIIGRGITTASRDFEPNSEYFYTGAGIWRTLSSYGVIFALVIYFIYYNGITELIKKYQFRKSFAPFFFVAIAIGATAQRFFMDDITMLLFVFGLLTLYDKKNRKGNIDIHRGLK